MNSDQFERRQLQYKKDKVVRTIYLTCEYCHLTVPTINFDGCPLEGANGPELAHYHTGGVNKICVSERQLKMQNLEELENTSIHEVIHHLGLMHGSSEEKTKFEKIKNYVKGRVWRPSSGVQFISAEQSREAEERIRQDPKRMAEINEDSDYVKFVEGRATRNVVKETEKKEKPKRAKKDKHTRGNREKTYKRMGKEEIEESRKKLGINVHKEEEAAKLDEKEQERLTNKAYENMDTGFGDEHGENRWNKKKKGFVLTASGKRWVDPATILKDELNAGSDLHKQLLAKTIEQLHKSNMLVVAPREREAHDLIAYPVDKRKKYLWDDKARMAYEIQTSARKDAIEINGAKKEKYGLPITWVTYDKEIMKDIKEITAGEDSYMLVDVKKDG